VRAGCLVGTRGILPANGVHDALVHGEHIVLALQKELLVDRQEQVRAHGVHGQSEPWAVGGARDAAVDPRISLKERGTPILVALTGECALDVLKLGRSASLRGELGEAALDGGAQLEDVVQLVGVDGHPLVPATLQGGNVVHP
jgi:hypothetical protein